MDLLTGSYENVHRRMAGKLSGPSSSKASTASTPIPLGIAITSNKCKEKSTHAYAINVMSHTKHPYIYPYTIILYTIDTQREYLRQGEFA